jgi:hypothetical protein
MLRGPSLRINNEWEMYSYNSFLSVGKMSENIGRHHLQFGLGIILFPLLFLTYLLPFVPCFLSFSLFVSIFLASCILFLFLSIFFHYFFHVSFFLTYSILSLPVYPLSLSLCVYRPCFLYSLLNSFIYSFIIPFIYQFILLSLSFCL